MESFDFTQGYFGSEQRKDGIFISYRRDDTAWPARSLYEHLRSGLTPVFMDVGTIHGGDDFPNEIRYHMSRCGIMLVLIGRDWLGATGLKRTRRIDEPEDWVHIEIKAALEQNIWAVPVLIDGVKMPKASDLPDGLRPLTRVSAFTLSHSNFDREIEDLKAHIEAVRKGYKILQGKWSLKLQYSEGSDHTFRLSSETRDYLIRISLTNRGKSTIAVDGQVEATTNSAATITGEEIDLAALSSELGTRATIKVEILNSNPARSNRNKPETSFCFTLRVGDRVFEYETEEYTRAQEQRRAEQRQKDLEMQWSQQRREQGAEQALRNYKHTVIGQNVGMGINAALKNDTIREALINALKRAKR